MRCCCSTRPLSIPRLRILNCLHFSICACHPCAGGHANLLHIVPILTDDPRRESSKTSHTKIVRFKISGGLPPERWVSLLFSLLSYFVCYVLMLTYCLLLSCLLWVYLLREVGFPSTIAVWCRGGGRGQARLRRRKRRSVENPVTYRLHGGRRLGRNTPDGVTEDA